jgi:hypothetical protein
MTALNDREPSPTGTGAAALLLGIALGAAALLLATPQGKRLLEQFSGLTEDWKAQAASVLAESREKVVSSVENPIPTDRDRRLRENL